MQNKHTSLIVGIIAALALVIGGAYIMVSNPKNNTAPVGTNQGSTTKAKDSSDSIKLVIEPKISFLTDAGTMTLYHTIKDYVENGKPIQSTCVGQCTAIWPPFYTEKIVVSTPLKTSNFSVFTRSDGKKQIAWRGLPLYYYSGDHNIGDSNGQGMENVWYIGVLPER